MSSYYIFWGALCSDIFGETAWKGTSIAKHIMNLVMTGDFCWDMKILKKNNDMEDVGRSNLANKKWHPLDRTKSSPWYRWP